MSKISLPTALEIRPDDYDHHWFQQGPGAPRFRPDHRVFKLAIGDRERGADEHWSAVMEWIDANALTIDGWTYRHTPDGGGAPVVNAAVWRFRRHQQIEAEMFAQAWVFGRAADIHPEASTTKH